MKKLGNIIGSIIIFISVITLSLSLLSTALFEKDIPKVVLQEMNIETKFNDVFASIDNYLPEEMKPIFTRVKEDILSEEKMGLIIDDFSRFIIKDILNEEGGYSDVDKHIIEAFSVYEKDISGAIGLEEQDDYLIKVMSEILSKAPLQPIYNIAIDSIKDSATYEFLIGLNIIDILLASNTYLLCMALIVGTIVLLVLMNRKTYAWKFPLTIPFYMGGITLTVGYLSANFLIKFIDSFDETMKVILMQRMQTLLWMGLLYVVIGLLIHLITNILLKKKR